MTLPLSKNTYIIHQTLDYFSTKETLFVNLQPFTEYKDNICIVFYFEEKNSLIIEKFTKQKNKDLKIELQTFIELKINNKRTTKNLFNSYDKNVYKRLPHLKKLLNDVISEIKEKKIGGFLRFVLVPLLKL